MRIPKYVLVVPSTLFVASFVFVGTTGLVHPYLIGHVLLGIPLGGLILAFFISHGRRGIIAGSILGSLVFSIISESPAVIIFVGGVTLIFKIFKNRLSRSLAIGVLIVLIPLGFWGVKLYRDLYVFYQPRESIFYR